jgi:hypothetical protein
MATAGLRVAHGKRSAIRSHRAQGRGARVLGGRRVRLPANGGNHPQARTPRRTAPASLRSPLNRGRRPHLHRRRPMSIRVRRARSGASPARAPRLRSRSRGRCPSRVTSTARCPPHLRRAARQIPAKSPFLPLSSSALRPPVRPCQTTGRNARRLLLEQTSAERTSCWFIYRQEPSPSPPLGRRLLRRVFHSNPGEGSSPRTRWCREQRG